MESYKDDMRKLQQRTKASGGRTETEVSSGNAGNTKEHTWKWQNPRTKEKNQTAATIPGPVYDTRKKKVVQASFHSDKKYFKIGKNTKRLKRDVRGLTSEEMKRYQDRMQKLQQRVEDSGGRAETQVSTPKNLKQWKGKNMLPTPEGVRTKSYHLREYVRHYSWLSHFPFPSPLTTIPRSLLPAIRKHTHTHIGTCGTHTPA